MKWTAYIGTLLSLDGKDKCTGYTGTDTVTVLNLGCVVFPVNTFLPSVKFKCLNVPETALD